jgi:hypothetical protein
MFGVKRHISLMTTTEASRINAMPTRPPITEKITDQPMLLIVSVIAATFFQ